MKHLKLFEGFLNEAKTENTLYLAGLTQRGDDEWIWQGYVIAKNKGAAKSLLTALVKEAGLGLSSIVDEGPTGKGEKVEAGIGVYDTTIYDQIKKGKAKAMKSTDLKKAIKKYSDLDAHDFAKEKK